MTLKCRECQFFYQEAVKGLSEGVWVGWRGQCLNREQSMTFVDGNLNKCKHFEKKQGKGGNE
jgi:hypothetical protein